MTAERVARNRAIAERYYDGYHGSVERGLLTNVFQPGDFADEWVFCSPFLGGEQQSPDDTFLAQGAVANHEVIWQRIPDYKMDDLDTWANDRGCAWRWRVHGTGIDGVHREFWEQLFVTTDDDARATRFEFFDDWHGFPQTLQFAYDQSGDELSKLQGYGRSPWPPPPTMDFAPPPPTVPPTDPRIAANLAVAERLFDVLHTAVERGGVDGVWPTELFADAWTFFSPWAGERRQAGSGAIAGVITSALRKAWKVLPDLRADHLAAMPTDDGCAWRWCLNGRTAAGVRYESWQQVFVRTDGDGRIIRLELFDDWLGFPQLAGLVTGLSIDELWSLDTAAAWLASP